ncbi:hypothetical protein AAFN88_10230 [Pelagibius sp. CAU 1746]|uniref:hypothetical protein n=1 Tax=Pelagibius sp. CAU 1746 TaxID=3140370 RepID=UPI00325BEE1B
MGVLLAGALGAVCTAGPAQADTWDVEVKSVNSPTVVVESNGNEYTDAVSGSSLHGTIALMVDAGWSGRVEFWSAWPRLGISKQQSGYVAVWGNFKTSGADKTYNSPRPKKVTEEFDFTIPRADYGSTAVVACNTHAQRLQEQGMSKSEILGSDRWVQVAIGAGINYNTTGASNDLPAEVEAFESFKKLNVICQASESLEPVAQAITGAYLNVKPVTKIVAQGTCDLELSGSLVSDLPNTQVKFVYVDDKGKKSDVKTVVTGGDGEVAFKHDYPAGNGQKSGKIRMVGQSHAFFSNWSNYETDCTKNPGDKVSLLPPKATHLEGIATADTVMYRGRICPTTVKIWGILEGRGEVSGGVAIFAGNQLKVLKQYQAEDGKQIVIQGEHTLSWEGNQTGQQNVSYRMNVTNAVGDLVDQLEAAQNFECKKPEVNAQFDNAPGGIASNDNLPKSVTLSLSTLGQKKLPGWVCPAKVRLHGNVMSDDQPLSGTAVLYVGETFIKEHDVELEANWGHNYDAEHELSWNAATQTEQTLDFTLKFANEHNYVVKTVKKTESFACQKISTTGIAGAGGLTGGQKPGQASQQAATGVLVQPQALPLAIMAPKGTVRKGEIRLTGGKPTATYKLSFFRKSGGKVTQVSSAQLPKQMKGMNASFPLAALSGGRSWQLRVCPVGKGPAACETSDFRIPLIGAKQEKAAPAKPKATVVIVPGALN